jgi:hypothetical protein
VNCHLPRATQHSPLPQAPQTAPSPHTPLPPTSAEFAEQVMAGLARPRSTGKTGECQAPQPVPATPPLHAEMPPTCHSERSEESAFSSSPAPQAPAPPPTQAQQPSSAPPSTPPQPAPVAHPFTSAALPPHIRRRLHRTAPPLATAGRIHPDSHLL